MFHHRARLFPFLLVFLIAGQQAAGMETDQFTTPRVRLSDIGVVLSRKIAEIIESDHTGADPERVLSAWVGSNVLTSRLGRWVKEVRVADGPASFRPRLSDSIYAATFSPVPASFLFDSPTVKVHGFYMGTDKIDHFFQQGYEYYERVRRAQEKGDGGAAGIAAAVAHGVHQEHTYYGTLVSGVYSNGDLAANYAGMKFYLNLRHPVTIGGREWPPLLEPTRDGWRFRTAVDREHVLQPFLSDHLDESLNPSRYRFGRGSIGARIHTRCESWSGFYADRLGLVARSGRSFAATWFGEDYGHWLPPADEVSMATECAPSGAR